MGEVEQHSDGIVALSTERLAPYTQRFGQHEIEFTFLGPNALGQPTWILWNSSEPHLIGMLSQGKMGYHFEQRTGVGVQRLENISLNRVQRALGG